MTRMIGWKSAVPAACAFLFMSPCFGAATVSLKVVAKNGVPVNPPLSTVTIAPFDTITVEVFLSGWNNPPFDGGSALVQTYQVSLLGTQGFLSNGAAASDISLHVLPSGWDAPFARDPCPCDNPRFPVCNLSYGCVGLAFNPNSMASINNNRTDYIFHGFNDIRAVAVDSLNIKWGATINGSDGQTASRCQGGSNAGGSCSVADHCPGGTCNANFQSYGGTLNLRAGSGVCGTTTLTLWNDIWTTFIANPAPIPFVVLPSIQGLTLIANNNPTCPPAPAPGACCNGTTGDCQENVLFASCVGRWGGPNSTCGTLDPACEPLRDCAQFSAISAGGYHSLAMRANGTVVAWGRNQYGEGASPVPNRDFVAISASGYHNLGLKSDGSIVSWGESVLVEEVPPPNSGFVAVAAGGDHFSLGLKSNGSIVFWGLNNDGEGSVPIPNSGFIAIAAGEDHCLGLKADGSIRAWGENFQGQTNVPAPNSGFIAISAGGEHSLGLKSDGSIVSWGNNSEGQLDVPAPNSGFVAIAAGAVHSLGLKSDGTIVAWGGNTVGPAPNVGFVAISGGGEHSLALWGDGTIVAWECSSGDYGQCTIPTDGSVLCDDGVDCTSDSCDETTGTCSHVVDIDSCNDGVFCNGDEVCNPLSGCVSGPLRDCDDGLDCTMDSCDIQDDICSHTPDHQSCSDSEFCNGAELCDPLIGCLAGPLPSCADDFPCTIDHCDALTDRCVHLPDDIACSNGLYCDGEESCSVITGCVAGLAPCAENQRCDEEFLVCEPGEVPAAGTWGLVVLSLLLLIGAKLKFPSVL